MDENKQVIKLHIADKALFIGYSARAYHRASQARNGGFLQGGIVFAVTLVCQFLMGVLPPHNYLPLALYGVLGSMMLLLFGLYIWFSRKFNYAYFLRQATVEFDAMIFEYAVKFEVEALTHGIEHGRDL